MLLITGYFSCWVPLSFVLMRGPGIREDTAERELLADDITIRLSSRDIGVTMWCCVNGFEEVYHFKNIGRCQISGEYCLCQIRFTFLWDRHVHANIGASRAREIFQGTRGEMFPRERYECRYKKTSLMFSSRQVSFAQHTFFARKIWEASTNSEQSGGNGTKRNGEVEQPWHSLICTYNN